MDTLPTSSPPVRVATRSVSVTRWRRGRDEHITRDDVAVEEPLEVRVGYTAEGQRRQQSVAVTMRTPGNDVELAVGFLLTEGIVRRRTDVVEAVECGSSGNVVRVELHPNVPVELARLERNFYTTSSCGVCGKASLDAVMRHGAAELSDRGMRFEAGILQRAPLRLAQAQPTFEATGGVHAAALFDERGDLVVTREDVGRHNAVDKVIGRCFLDDVLPVLDLAMVVSGRVSFEIVQKALMAGVPLLVAVGAPSSLAVELAERYGMTLVAFARDERVNVYTHHYRVPGADA